MSLKPPGIEDPTNGQFAMSWDIYIIRGMGGSLLGAGTRDAKGLVGNRMPSLALRVCWGFSGLGFRF